jgi:Fe-S cluster biogenesis protein NfuA
LEDLRLKFKGLCFLMTDDQFMGQVLSILTNEYKLQMLLLEKRIGSKENPSTIEELKEELSLRYEGLLMKTETAKINDLYEEKALVVTQFKGECQGCGKIGHRAAQCKSKQMREGKNELICNYCKKPGHL